MEIGKGSLREKLAETRFPNQKTDRMWRLSQWWQSSTLPDELISDVRNERQREFELRNEISKYAPGIALKGASLFINKLGYENVISIDLWMMRFLEEIGHQVPLPNYITQSSPSGNDYMKYERIITEISKGEDVSPVLFQFAIWAKGSGWKPGNS